MSKEDEENLNSDEENEEEEELEDEEEEEESEDDDDSDDTDDDDSDDDDDDDEDEEETAEEKAERLEKELEKVTKENKTLKIQKAKKKKKKDKPAATDEPQLSTKDLLALQQNNVHVDDVDEVLKASKLLNKSIPETLKDNMVVSLLKRNEEHRKTADATDSRSKRGGKKSSSSAQILKDASEGKLPEKGSKEAEKLFWARRGGKR